VIHGRTSGSHASLPGSSAARPPYPTGRTQEEPVADPQDAWDDNVPGRFYVDHACINCSVCTDVAPAIFALADAEDHSRVIRQPRTPEEEVAAREALESCPMDAIGDRDASG
jgi:ferredoxin